MKNLLTTILICAYTTVFSQVADSTQFYLQKGIAEKQAKRYLVASQCFDKALKFDPRNIDALLENAAVCMEMRKTDQAKVFYLKLIELNPSHKVAISDLMSIYYNYRQFDQALEMAKKCPDCANALRITGMSYYQNEEYTLAETALRSVLANDPADAEATYTLARTYVDMEEYIKAIPWYEKAVKMESAKPMWMYERGILLFNQSDYVNAVASFKQAAGKGYNQTLDFKENLGYASLYTGDYDEGEKLLMEIWMKKPGNKDLLRGLAEVLYQQRQFDRSLNYCQKLMELDAKDGKALYQAGMCFQKKGEKDRGQQMCDKAIEMDPSLAGLRRKKDIVGL